MKHVEGDKNYYAYVPSSLLSQFHNFIIDSQLVHLSEQLPSLVA